uniref:Uncharacterized protein n=1 Tax=Knipowitschia caucasica TaxID=637954 RepID=A0AAV2JP18_KNICA
MGMIVSSSHTCQSASGVSHGERRRAEVAILIAPHLSRHVLEFSPVNERVASLRLRVGDKSLTVVTSYGPNGSAEYRPSWSPWEGYWTVHRPGTPLFSWGTSTPMWEMPVTLGEG